MRWQSKQPFDSTSVLPRTSSPAATCRASGRERLCRSDATAQVHRRINAALSADWSNVHGPASQRGGYAMRRRGSRALAQASS